MKSSDLVCQTCIWSHEFTDVIYCEHDPVEVNRDRSSLRCSQGLWIVIFPDGKHRVIDFENYVSSLKSNFNYLVPTATINKTRSVEFWNDEFVLLAMEDFE